jgi:Domain of unknown function (DUF4145)
MSWWDFGEKSGFDGKELALYRIDCPFCSEKGNFSTIHHEERKHPSTQKVLNYDTMRCGNCGNLMMVFWSAAATSYRRGMHNFRVVPWSQRTSRFPDYWPEDVGRFWVQARRNLEGQNWDAAAVMARSAVQLITRYQKGKGGNLKQEIDDLADKGILPPVMREWSHEVRLLGNEGAHPKPGAEGTEAQDAKDIVEFLAVLLTMTNDLPHQIEQYRERRNAKNAKKKEK